MYLMKNKKEFVTENLTVAGKNMGSWEFEIRFY
jgi:hypothetical protein